MAMSKIELRVSDVAPPTPEPPRTIYRDLFNLPDPVILGLTIRYYNFDEVGLYFRVTGSGIGYTFGTVILGLLASGTNAYVNLDNFGSRAKPAGEILESINLILRAYTDAAYTNLKWEYVRTVTVIWIDSSDPGYTVDVNNNFDDGTVQGWSAVQETGGPSCTCAVAQDYVLSPPYSLKMTHTSGEGGGWFQQQGRLQKAITTPNRNYVYAVLDIRCTALDEPNAKINRVFILRDGSILIWIGRDENLTSDAFPRNKWMRIVTPLPKDTALSFRISLRWYANYGVGVTRKGYIWLDDFKVISKD